MKICGLLNRFCIFLFVGAAVGTSVKKTGSGAQQASSMTVVMNGFTPTKDEQYVCTGYKSPESGYIVAFRPNADKERVHHMILFGCETPWYPEEGRIWDCLGGGSCRKGSKIFYAWARNAPSLILPPDVGFPIGALGSIKYFVLQVHYASKFDGAVEDFSGVTLDLVSNRPQYIAAIYLFMAGAGPVPPETESYYMNISCPYRGETDLHPFAFRTHAHSLGRVISAAVRHNGSWTIIGKRNPLWPQMFQPIDNGPFIGQGDVLAAQCRYTSIGRHKSTHIGAFGENEMCNFYMMFYRKADAEDPFKFNVGCSHPGDMSVFREYPADASSLLPRNAVLEEEAHLSNDSFGVVEAGRWTKYGSNPLGQISGLALDIEGNIVVFHRGEVVWGPGTFDARTNTLRKRESVKADAVVTLHKNSGEFLSSWGKGHFYVPHGMTVDASGAVWLTDVGLHQVLKFMKQSGKMVLERVWGEAFVPGDDTAHFCKPAAVAVASDGSFFVADGYCNARIISFGPDGRFRQQWGQKSSDVEAPLGSFLLPHDIHVDEARQKLLVADRENGRVQLLHFNGTPVSELRPPPQFLTVYSVDFSSQTDTVFLLPGERPRSSAEDIKVFAVSSKTKLVTYSWTPKSQRFERPHVLRCSEDGKTVFVGEISGAGGVLWKFQVKTERSKTVEGKQVKGRGTAVPVNAATRKNLEAESEAVLPHSLSHLLLVLSAAIGLPILLILLTCLCIKFRKQGGFRTLNMMSMSDGYFKDGKLGGTVPLLDGAFRSHKGFQLLRTEDIDGIDDLTDESENEDTLYPVSKNGPLNT